MSHSEILSPLTAAQRHVLGARRIVAAQEAVVAAIQAEGGDASDAMDVLRSFRQTLADFEADVRRLSNSE